MRLGGSQAAYRWVSYPGLRIDQPEFGFRGMRYPYGTTTVGPAGLDDHVDWWIDRCVEHRFEALHMGSSWFADAEASAATGRRMAEYGIEWVGSVSGAWAVESAEWPAVRAEAVRSLEILHAGGCRLTEIVNADPPGPPGQPVPNGGLRFGHFSREVPMAVQIDCMIENLRDLVRVAADLGIVLAFENHMDYRISEIVPVVEGVASPWLRINYDFSNSLAVVEDQVEAARLAAPYVAMAHLRDMRVQSITTTGEPKFFHAPVGHGSVEIAEIFAILQAGAPDPDAIPVCLEPPCLPDYDPQLWVRLSIDWLGEHCAQYFPRFFGTAMDGVGWEARVGRSG